MRFSSVLILKKCWFCCFVIQHKHHKPSRAAWNTKGHKSELFCRPKLSISTLYQNTRLIWSVSLRHVFQKHGFRLMTKQLCIINYSHAQKMWKREKCTAWMFDCNICGLSHHKRCWLSQIHKCPWSFARMGRHNLVQTENCLALTMVFLFIKHTLCNINLISTWIKRQKISF